MAVSMRHPDTCEKCGKWHDGLIGCEGKEDKPSTDRILKSLKARDGMYGGSKDVSRYDVACVLKALADHTLIMEMMEFNPDPTSPWVEATSVGRWFHAAADKLFDEEDGR